MKSLIGLAKRKLSTMFFD
jgi:hypothetical protein